MTNEYYFERPANVRMTIDTRILDESKRSIDSNKIIIQWTLKERKVITVKTFEFTVLNTTEALRRISELYTLNGDIFNKIEMWNE